METNNISELFAPGVTDYVEALLTQGRVGICGGTLRIIDIGSSSPNMITEKKTEAIADRFKLVIPYAGISLQWEILFNYCHPEEPPDVIFGSQDKNFDPDISKIESLVNWNALNTKSLLYMTQELLAEYSLFQISQVAYHSRLQFEYSSLIETSFEPTDIEVHVTMKDKNRVGATNFLIKLDIDFTQLPGYLTKDNPGEDTAVLCVTFETPDGGKVSPQLYLSPRVEHALGGTGTMRIPPYSSMGGLIDYVPTVCQLLRKKVEQVVQGFDKRKDYIAAFLSDFGRSVIEYDAEGFSKISFIMEWHDFFFVIIIELDQSFPAVQPVLRFQSAYHESSDSRPYCTTIRTYPYSPRWTGSEMAKRARAYILDYIPGFQRASVKDGAL